MTIDNIVDNIELYEEFGISGYIKNTSLRRSAKEQRVLIECLLDKGYELIVNGRINPILNSNNKILREKYGIDIKELTKQKQLRLYRKKEEYE